MSPASKEPTDHYRASDLKVWNHTRTISVLREALPQSDSAACQAYQVQDNHRVTHTAAEYAEALAVVGCAAGTLTFRRRPREIEPDGLSLPEWRQRVWKLLREVAMPGNALPRSSTSQAPADLGCQCCELDSPKALAGEHTP